MGTPVQENRHGYLDGRNTRCIHGQEKESHWQSVAFWLLAWQLLCRSAALRNRLEKMWFFRQNAKIWTVQPLGRIFMGSNFRGIPAAVSATWPVKHWLLRWKHRKMECMNSPLVLHRFWTKMDGNRPSPSMVQNLWWRCRIPTLGQISALAFTVWKKGRIRFRFYRDMVMVLMIRLP